MRIASATLLLLLTLSAAHAQPEGVEVSPKGGRFKVRFPGKPKETTAKTKTAVGEATVTTVTYATPEGSIYVATHIEYPTTPKADDHLTFLAGARDGIVGKDGKLVSEAPVSHGPDKLAGREVVVDKGKVQVRYRLFFKENRLYQIGALGTGAFVTGKAASDFLDSFEFVK
ncbi:hypothetical protein J0H58_12425 [bacterium]|nr:hypothetical protein [bacterium]